MKDWRICFMVFRIKSSSNAIPVHVHNKYVYFADQILERMQSLRMMRMVVRRRMQMRMMMRMHGHGRMNRNGCHMMRMGDGMVVHHVQCAARR